MRTMPSHPDALLMRIVRLAVGDVTLDVDLDEGARAVSWAVAGHELLAHHGDDPVEHGMYPMAPWAGRLRGNEVTWGGRTHPLPETYGPWALHGTVYARPATVVREEHAADEAVLVVRFDEHPGWPWSTRVDVEWRLRARTLTTCITVHAEQESMPGVVGWHPWFRRDIGVGGSLEWSLDATARLVRGDDHLPTGALADYDPADGPFDDAFVAASAQVRWPGALRIDIASDGGWFVVFDELAGSVCIEPQSGPPDGLHEQAGHAPRVASPGEPLVLTSTWTISDEPPAGPA
jgi:aldose 1-epimerase